MHQYALMFTISTNFHNVGKLVCTSMHQYALEMLWNGNQGVRIRKFRSWCIISEKKRHQQCFAVGHYGTGNWMKFLGIHKYTLRGMHQYAPVCSSMPSHIHLIQNFQNVGKLVCTSMHQYALTVLFSTKFAKCRQTCMHRYAPVCTSMHQYALNSC